MARESIITVYRSTATDVPTGLTFGELAYSDLNGKLFVGKNNGSSLWVGAEITGGAIGDNAYLVPTQSAVKSYVEGIVGGGSVVNSVNGSSGAVTITGDNGAISNVQVGGANTVRARLATTGETGVASFSSSNFSVSNGSVSIKSGGVTNGNLQNSSVTVNSGTGLVGGGTVALGGSITLSNVGVLSFNGTTGAVQYSPAIASGSATGVASFNSTYFSVDGNGAVSLATAYQATGDTVQAGSFISISANKTISNIGVQTLNGLTGARTLTGDGGAIVGVGNNTIRARLASTGATGVASFSSDNFDVSAAGVVTIKDSGITNAEIAAPFVTLKDSSGDGGQAINLGTSFSIEGTTNEITTSRDGSKITVGLPDDVVISGNLTVNGTVVTTNVNNFVVEDPLFMLGTGNSDDTLDLGFYGLYTEGATKKYTGLFRDSQDATFAGKYRLFTGLTVEPTTSVNAGGAGYAMATLVARIDGGTF